MYQDEGYMKPLTEEEHKKLLGKQPYVEKVFAVGQVVTINGAWFRVKSIKPKELRLKVIPRPDDATGS